MDGRHKRWPSPGFAQRTDASLESEAILNQQRDDAGGAHALVREQPSCEEYQAADGYDCAEGDTRNASKPVAEQEQN
jgi:hypothetical protein